MCALQLCGLLVSSRMRARQKIIVAALALVSLCIFTLIRSSPPTGAWQPVALNSNRKPLSSAPDPKPKPGPRGSHPIWHLINNAEHELEAVKTRQSKTLRDAVAEYRRRYKTPPPPNFDKWFKFAQERGVQLVDEFDTIHDLITPFWGLKPSTIRARAKEALGRDNSLMGVQIRGGKVTHVAGAKEWQREATAGMMKGFVAHLPDMDLAFNVHDEPRVVVPYEDMARLIAKAKDVNMPAAYAAAEPRNSFTEKPSGINDGGRFEEAAVTRFNVFAHQATWTHSRMSCPPDSPSRILEEDERVDDRSRYALGELGFVYNETAMSDICLSPSLGSRYGFFDRPNAYNIVHDLFPIFSQSKISSYADIIYPSPWYWFEKVAYDEKQDKPWPEKLDRRTGGARRRAGSAGRAGGGGSTGSGSCGGSTRRIRPRSWPTGAARPTRTGRCRRCRGATTRTSWTSTSRT